MKTRLVFVSNSSSSSFVCDITGRVESGWDLCLEDAEMYECENGHTFCRSEVLYDEDIHKQLLEIVGGDDWIDIDDYDLESLSDFSEIDDFGYTLPECCCPICQRLVYSEGDMKLYLQSKFGDVTQEAFEDVKVINKRRKKLYDSEYITFACKKFGTTVDEMFEEIKSFNSYSEFKKSLK